MLDTWIHTLLHKMDTYIITESGYIHYNIQWIHTLQHDRQQKWYEIDFLACPLSSDVWD